MTTHEVIFQPEGIRVKIQDKTTVYDAAKHAGIDFVSICGGKGTCCKCKIRINPEKFTQPITESEKKCLTPEEIKGGIRLACQTKIEPNLIVHVPQSSRTGKQRLQVEGIKTLVDLDSIIQKYTIHLPKPTLEDLRSDLDRLLDELKIQHNLTNIEMRYDLLKALGPFLRNSKWNITVTIWNKNQIIAVESGDTTHRSYGLSLDIGTTKLAAYLLNMITGEVVAVDSAMNPQIQYGEDIISRINYICSGNADNSAVLQNLLIQKVNDLIVGLCEKTGISFKEIYEMTAVGNTAMHHIFLDLDPTHLALAPYTPVIRSGINLIAKDFGIKINPLGNIYCLPVIAGYNGSDNLAVILATKLYEKDELCMAMDIGTNTEVALGNKEKIIVCSCASGPAFEGASIKYGIRATSGAIERIQIDPETFKTDYKTIDELKPRGICGSGIVDVIAEMFKVGIIDHTGKMNKTIKSDLLRKSIDGYEFILTRANETAIGKDITITQKDVRQLTLAKAAMHTGAVLLMEELGVTESDIDKVFIAGAFGNYIDVANARFIGMYPEIELSKVKTVGNAAGTGARMVLLSKAMRTLAETISRQIKYVELAVKNNFQSVYLNSTYLPYADLTMYPATSTLLKELGRYPEKLPHIF